MYEDDWKTLVGNCSSIIFLGSQEPEVLKYFSEMLGKMTIRVRSEGLTSGGRSGSNQNYQSTAREVMTAEELGRLPSDECIVFTQNMRAVRDKKYTYVESSLVIGRLLMRMTISDSSTRKCPFTKIQKTGFIESLNKSESGKRQDTIGT